MSLGLASAGVGVICLLAALLVWNLWDGAAPRRIVLALVITGSTGLAGSQLGVWLRDLTGEADAVVASAAGQVTGSAISGLLGIVALGVVIYGVVKQVNRWTLIAAAVLPLVVLTIPGPAGQMLTNLVNFIAGLIGWLVAAPFGLTT